jgi:helix-turn-helix protein
MSVAASSWAWEQALRPTEKLVLVALADFADVNGEHCYPGVARIANMTGLTVRAVFKTLAELERKKFVARARRWSHGHQTSSSYVLICDADRLDYGASKSESGSGIESERRSVLTRNHDGTVFRASVNGVHASKTVRNDPSVDPKARERRADDARRARADDKSLWPEGFALDAEMRAYANRRGLDADAEFVAFRNDALAHGRTNRDWRFAFRAWCDKAPDFGPKKRAPNPAPAETTLAKLRGAERETSDPKKRAEGLALLKEIGKSIGRKL